MEHLAVIMDGNGRWAERRHLPRLMGHRAGADEIPLQTIVRSNPGLVLIRDGVIVNKWSHADIPSDEDLWGPLDEISVGQSPEPDPMKTPWAVALMFGLPLLLLVAIDRLKELIQ